MNSHSLIRSSIPRAFRGAFLAGCGLLALAASACSSSSSSDAGTPVVVADGGTSGNLIVNGNAEAAVPLDAGSSTQTPSWTNLGNTQSVTYGDERGYPAPTDPGPSDRGLYFFAGGSDILASQITQTVDLTRYATAIDRGGVAFTLGAFIGGYSSQEDNAVLTVFFKDASATTLKRATLGPVTAEDRMSMTGLLARSSTGTVPAGARSAAVEVDMLRVEGSANDGYIDNMSLILTGI